MINWKKVWREYDAWVRDLKGDISINEVRAKLEKLVDKYSVKTRSQHE